MRPSVKLALRILTKNLAAFVWWDWEIAYQVDNLESANCSNNFAGLGNPLECLKNHLSILQKYQTSATTCFKNDKISIVSITSQWQDIAALLENFLSNGANIKCQVLPKNRTKDRSIINVLGCMTILLKKLVAPIFKVF